MRKKQQSNKQRYKKRGIYIYSQTISVFFSSLVKSPADAAAVFRNAQSVHSDAHTDPSKHP
jgi:hypothetical protein